MYNGNLPYPKLPFRYIMTSLCTGRRRIWQKKWGKTDRDSIQIDPTDMDGTYGQSPKGQGGTRAISGITKLTMDTPL